MKTAIISDITLRKAAGGKGVALSFREKLETAKLLDRLGADVIELPAIADRKADTLLLKTICPLVRHSVISCVGGTSKEETDRAWAAISTAAKPRLHIMLPTSAVQMEYTLHIKPAMMAEYIHRLVTYALSLCPDVEFSAVDATRSEPDFLRGCIAEAIAAGAGTITVCDTASLLLPEEFGGFIAALKADLPLLAGIELMAECGNELNMGAANAFAALTAGADGVKAIIDHNGYPSLTDLCGIIRARGDSLGIACGIRVTELHKAVGEMTWFDPQGRKDTAAQPVTQANKDFSLDAATDIGALAAAAGQLGYDLTPEELAEVYSSFQRVVSKKKVGSRELEAIIASSASQEQPAYMLTSYVINTGNLISSTAAITLDKQGETLHGLCYGDGPIDAAFKAIEQIIGHHYEVDDFSIRAVTEGREAVGDTIVKLRCEGRLYSGRGVSTDIVGAGIRAYLNALNKILSEGR